MHLFLRVIVCICLHECACKDVYVYKSLPNESSLSAHSDSLCFLFVLKAFGAPSFFQRLCQVFIWSLSDIFHKLRPADLTTQTFFNQKGWKANAEEEQILSDIMRQCVFLSNLENCNEELFAVIFH